MNRDAKGPAALDRTQPAARFDPLFFERDALFWPIAGPASAFAGFAAWPPIEAYSSAVPHRAPVRFREQPPRPRRHRRGAVTATDLYDGRIVEQGWVPTRPASWHDYLNMLVWASFPAAKWQLHTRQHRAQSARIEGAVRALPNARTPEQDALALLDEGGVAVVCARERAAEVHAALASRSDAATRGSAEGGTRQNEADEARARREAAGGARALFERGAAAAVIFGHALYESLVFGQAGVWGAAFVVPQDGALDLSPAALVRAADAGLASALAESGRLSSTADLVRVDLALLRPT